VSEGEGRYGDRGDFMRGRHTTAVTCHPSSPRQIMFVETSLLDGLLGEDVAGCEENLL
jgi:hypothetical protein